jgi:hypothetical protein
MPITIVYTDDNSGVIFHQEGSVNGTELYDKMLEVFADERYPNLKFWISDRTNCDEFLLDGSDLIKIAQLSNKESERNPGLLLAFVSPSDLSYGMLRRYEGAHISGTKFKTRVFRDANSANYWIQEEIGYDKPLC